jgi:hypothetical protein
MLGVHKSHQLTKIHVTNFGSQNIAPGIFTTVLSVRCLGTTHLMKLIITILLISLAEVSYARGGYCYSGICQFTGWIIGLFLLGLLILSVIVNVLDKGIIKGLLGHPVTLYVIGISSISLFLGYIIKENKDLGVIVSLALVFVLYLWDKKSTNKKSNNKNITKS